MTKRPTPPVEHPFKHRQVVAHRRLLGVRFKDGALGYYEDWSESCTVMARQRDWRPMGYVVVEFAHGGSLCVHHSQLRADLSDVVLGEARKILLGRIAAIMDEEKAHPKACPDLLGYLDSLGSAAFMARTAEELADVTRQFDDLGFTPAQVVQELEGV